MNLGLKGKRALITGGSHGIGLATALALAEEGAQIAICSRSKDRLDDARKKIEAKGAEVFTGQVDVLIPDQIHRFMDDLEKAWGGTLHILVNNVGGGGRWGKPDSVETDEKTWLEVYEKNAMATVRFTQRALPWMEKARWGRVVTITSIFGKEAGGRPWFNMSKAAQTSMMKCLSKERRWVHAGITFNTLAPGHIMIPSTGNQSEMDANPEEFQKRMDREFPLGRMGTPEEVGSVITFLCSERASLVNGACLLVDGGESHAF